MSDSCGKQTANSSPLAEQASQSSAMRVEEFIKHAAAPGLEIEDLDTLVPVPSLGTPCGEGLGLAVCPTLGLLATSDECENTLSVFALPSSWDACAVSRTGLAHVRTLGGEGSPPPMQFGFSDGGGRLAFTATAHGRPGTLRHLLVTDTTNHTVHVIDVTAGVHVGYVAAPGSLPSPQGVAASGSLAAVSAAGGGVHLFEGDGAASWSRLRVLGGTQLRCAGIRFTRDGLGVVGADAVRGRVGLLRVCDGALVGHLTTGLLSPHDVEECEGGWLVATFAPGEVDLVDPCGLIRCTLSRSADRGCLLDGPTAIAVVPGVGLAIRDYGNGGQVQFFATPDAVAKASMSAPRIAWMGGVVRAMTAARGPS